MIVELMLANHPQECLTCSRNQKCELQKLAKELGIQDVRFRGERRSIDVDDSSPIIRDPETYERFEQVILTHTCRQVGELKYGEELVAALKDDPLVGEHVHRLVHYTTVTREPWPNRKRITACIEDGQLFADLGVPALDPAHDRVMVCGSMDMLTDVKRLVEKAGLREGSNADPGEFVIEKAFVG